MAVTLAESKPAVSANRRHHDQPLPTAVQGSLQMLELFGHVVLGDPHETRKIPRGCRAVEQSGANALPYGSLSTLIHDVLHGVSRRG
jgi:hypothetical protein